MEILHPINQSSDLTKSTERKDFIVLPSNVADAQRIPFCRPCLASMCPAASETKHTLLSFGIEIQLVSTIISWMVSEEVGGECQSW